MDFTFKKTQLHRTFNHLQPDPDSDSEQLYVSDTLIIGSDRGRFLTWNMPGPSALKPLPDDLQEMEGASFKPNYIQQVVEGVTRCRREQKWHKTTGRLLQEIVVLSLMTARVI